MSNQPLMIVWIMVSAVLVALLVYLIVVLCLRPRPERIEARPQASEHAKEAMPIDPEHPPTWVVYEPGDGAPGRACACHPDRALRPGQRLLWWPVPLSGGGVNVFCEDGVEVAQ